MFRHICKLCQTTSTKRISNLKQYSVTSTLNTYINMFPNYEDEEIKEIPKETLNPIISCKRKEFNHYPNKVYKKTDEIIIASKGWHHYKSKGDYFTINPILESDDDDDEVNENCTFKDFDIDPRLIDKINKTNIHQPTTIQRLAIPKILLGQNVIITAETGCGKTLTYLLPIITQILKWKSEIGCRPTNSPLAVIVTPSRELTLQIAREVKLLTSDLDIGMRKLIGGRTKKIIRGGAVNNVDILIGTLGVINKLTSVGLFKLNCVRYTVIDEAHALFHETFDAKMSTFLRKINFGFAQTNESAPRSSQLILTSATMPQNFPEYLGKNVQLDSLVDVKTRNCHRVLVPQKFLRLGETEKPPTLLKLIKSKVGQKIATIVFSNSSSTSDWISIFLNQMNIKATSLNSQMHTVIRKDKFLLFQNGEVNVLSTTNAGARGLNTVAVDCVINYDFPLNTADYVHRCGRTGRIGGSPNGQVINFITKSLEVDLVQKIERAARRNKVLPMFDIAEQLQEKEMDEELKQLMTVAKNM